jgi:hypothetical protein
LCAFEKGNAQGARLVMPSADRFAIQKRLAETEERIALGQRQVAQQQELIVKLEADGQSAAHAKYLLAGLELLQAARRDSRDKLRKRLGQSKTN